MHVLGGYPALQNAHKRDYDTSCFVEIDDISFEIFVGVKFNDYYFHSNLDKQISFPSQYNIVKYLDGLDAHANAVSCNFEEVFAENGITDRFGHILGVYLCGKVEIIVDFVSDKHGCEI